jgi:outer membrane protein assembly factor BamB
LLALSFGSSGIETLYAQTPDGQPIRGEVLQLGAPGFLDWNAAVRKDRVRRASSLLGASGQVPTAVHPPMPVPVMPPPPGLAAPGAPAVPDLPAVPPASSDEPLAPATSASFASLGDNSAAIPPDTHGAVGPTELMTMLNTQYQRQNRTGLTVGGPLSIYGFWVGAGVSPTAPPYGPFDPRVHYDPDIAYGQGRFITVACQAAAHQTSALLVAVSTGSTPSSWYAWKIEADPANLPGSGVWFDYPTVGFNTKWIVVQVNVFAYPGNAFVESRIYVFNKADLYDGGSQGLVTLITPTPATYGATQVPALSYDAGPDLYFLQRWNPDSSGIGYLRIYELSGNVGSETLTPLGFPSAPAWSESAAGRVDFAPQGPSCGGAKIQTNDSRIQNVVQRDGELWATHTVFYPAGGTPTRASVQWWQVQTDATVVQRGLVDDAGNARFYAFPSIAVNKNEDVMLGFSSFAASEPASARYTFRLATDAPGTMQTPSVLKAGEACYFKDGGTLKNRWGDYSATVVDPIDDTKMWTLQEYASATDYQNNPAPNVWRTWWGMIDPTPVISITDPFVLEGNSGTTSMTFDLALSVPTSQAVTVDWATDNDSATVGDNDYVAASGTVVFAPGETAKTVTVAVKGDVKKEPLESFFVNYSLVTPGNATLPDAQAVGTIGNDDPDPQISIGDKQVLEGPSGTTPAVFLVTLSNPSSTTVTVTFNAAGVTATPGSTNPPADFNPATGTLTFLAGDVEEPITVTVLADSTVEPDETFVVNLSAPLGGTILKGVGNGVILNDDPVPTFPGVSFVAVVSDGASAAGSGRNRLEWLNPVTTTATGIRIRKNQTTLPTPCTYPADENDGSGVANVAFGGSGTTQSYSDTGLDLGDAYCYSVFVEHTSPTFSGGASAQGQPFDAVSGKTRWKYFTGLGATTVAPPTVGTDGVLVPSNDNLVHAMVRGAAGGAWPTSWKPANLGSPAQARSPIVPFAGGSRAFFSTLDGWVHAIDAKTGAVLWETQIGTAAQTGAGGAPAGIFTAFGGAWDYILVGTRQSANNRFYALDPATGAVIDSFPGGAGDPVGEMGAVTGMASVDYARSQVYFGTFLGATNALWCLKLGPPSDALQRGWEVPRAVTGDIDGSPVTRGARVYVGTTAGLLWSIQATDGLGQYPHTPVGPPESVKGFPFPDRNSQALYFSTTTRIHSAVDNGIGNFLQKWPALTDLTSPSPPLFWAAQDRLYVGMQAYLSSPSGAWLYDINAATGGATAVQLESGTPIAIGAPSLDTGVTPVMLHAGSVAGVIYAVQVP